MKIEVVGQPSSVTDAAYENVAAALEQAGLEAEVVRVEDMEGIVARGVVMAPGVFIDGALKCTAKVPTVEEVIGWIKE